MMIVSSTVLTPKTQMLKLKSLSPLFAPLALASVISMGDVAVHSFLPQFQNTAIAAPEMTVGKNTIFINVILPIKPVLNPNKMVI